MTSSQNTLEKPQKTLIKTSQNPQKTLKITLKKPLKTKNNKKMEKIFKKPVTYCRIPLDDCYIPKNYR
jgi:predicted aldo/keto reductase-like oxidoreductase